MKENVPLVLSYHYLNCPGELKPGATCEMSRFKGHLRWLKDNHYTVVMLSQIVELIREGKPLPPKTAAISFDDGLRDGYKRAYPLLKQYGFPATFFVITCALEGKLPPVIGFQILIQELGADKIRKEILPEFLKGTGYVGLLDPKRYNIREDKKPELEEFRLIKWIFNHFLPVS
ncbi:MAG: polysaccharide deacetylase family protein, partial [Patescibacteria group bacterium]